MKEKLYKVWYRYQVVDTAEVTLPGDVDPDDIGSRLSDEVRERTMDNFEMIEYEEIPGTA